MAFYQDVQTQIKQFYMRGTEENNHRSITIRGVVIAWYHLRKILIHKFMSHQHSK